MMEIGNEIYPIKGVVCRAVLQDLEPVFCSTEMVEDSCTAIDLFRDELAGYKVEHFIVLMLDQNKRPINYSVIGKGSERLCPVDTRKILKIAVLCDAAAVIAYHNHPTSNILPSRLDIELTEHLSRSCLAVGVTLLDHIIIDYAGDAYSFADAGRMEEINKKVGVK